MAQATLDPESFNAQRESDFYASLGEHETQYAQFVAESAPYEPTDADYQDREAYYAERACPCCGGSGWVEGVVGMHCCPECGGGPEYDHV